MLKRNAAIQVGESATFSIALPAKHADDEIAILLDRNAPRIQHALWLMDRYGTLGGRSRNGWGSFALTPLDGTPALTGKAPLRPWRKALGLDWPHSIGTDGQPLIWHTTKAFDDWRQLMRELAIVKIGLRTQFLFATGNNAPRPEARHWLSHPITKHNVGAWKQGRLPNSLRFKVRPAPNDPNKLVGTIFHVPCLPPAEFRPDRQAIERTWKSVHALLDELTRPVQSRSYASILDATRSAQLKPQLDSVTLESRSDKT